MRDYKDFEPSVAKSSVFPWTSFIFGTGIIIICIIAFAYLSHKLDNRQEIIAAATSTDEFLPQPPSPESEYEFYNLLTKEEPVRLKRNDNDEAVASSSTTVYYVRVPDYESYDDAINDAKKMISWGILNQMKIEPYENEQQILFSIRIGPFTSRSQMNAQRDILYDREISNEGLGFKK